MGAAAATHTGRVRDGNEDAYAISPSAWVVADGMGGHSGGEVAARAAADAALEAEPDDVVAVAHRAVLAATTEDLYDMGTTLVHAVLLDEQLQVHWAGDSRAYLLDGDGLHLLTSDHNQAEELRAQGHLTEEQARTHPGQYRLTRALGLGRPTPPEPGVVCVPARGRLLLCSDGLTSELDDAAVGALLAEGTPEDAARALVDSAVEAGGRDNVTVVVVDLPERAAA
jgi:protein phosphatase